MDHPYAAYLESNIVSASPLELVRMLYRAAIDSVRDARRFLAEGKIRERSAAVTRAIDILVELSNSLDMSAGELPQRLALLYDYMQRRLIEANFAQRDELLAETLSLLETVGQAWDTVAAQETIAPVEPAIASAPQGNISSPWDQNPVPEDREVVAMEGWTL